MRFRPTTITTAHRAIGAAAWADSASFSAWSLAVSGSFDGTLGLDTLKSGLQFATLEVHE